jgi:hypothetical protein
MIKLHNEESITVNDLKKAIVICSGFPFKILKKKYKSEAVKIWRQIYYYFANTYKIQSYYQAAMEFNQDHATAIHGKKFIENGIKLGYEDIISRVNQVSNYLNSLERNITNEEKFMKTILFNALHMSENTFYDFLKKNIKNYG